ncbi:hypothetical protein Dvina_36575 [Dactylosporangium vinaceum]|uniref:Uncharacterized protein n=1 Tax=Dactylosporangium vinaceum TaxID=53362 RepID=A0ABV5MJ10_9ACTN|nr:hypothetical protein [Dactylosporangium vinaceum]UAB93707.1 hypothetical protein Dvina_36575 [Dactylosporangium vinaceum]
MSRRPTEPAPAEPGRRLPLRWAFILGVAAFAGVAAESVGGPAAGITAGAIIAGLLHAVLD